MGVCLEEGMCANCNIPKRNPRVKAEAMYLDKSQHLARIKKEPHARNKKGQDICYVIMDRMGKIALCSQKLTAVTEFINTTLVRPDEPWTRVNTVGLWEIINQTGGRVGGYHKGRFRVLSVDLESAPERFEEVRKEHEEAAVIGIPACYQVCV